MYGNTMGTLKVYAGQKVIFTKSGDQGNQWNKATLNVTEAGATEVSSHDSASADYFLDAS